MVKYTRENLMEGKDFAGEKPLAWQPVPIDWEHIKKEVGGCQADNTRGDTCTTFPFPFHLVNHITLRFGLILFLFTACITLVSRIQA